MELTQNTGFLPQVAKWVKCGIKEVTIGAITYKINADLFNSGFITVCAQNNTTNKGVLYTIAISNNCVYVTTYNLDEYGACDLITRITTHDTNIITLFDFAI